MLITKGLFLKGFAELTAYVGAGEMAIAYSGEIREGSSDAAPKTNYADAAINGEIITTPGSTFASGSLEGGGDTTTSKDSNVSEEELQESYKQQNSNVIKVKKGETIIAPNRPK